MESFGRSSTEANVREPSTVLTSKNEDINVKEEKGAEEGEKEKEKEKENEKENLCAYCGFEERFLGNQFVMVS
jgi:hypothetical protein